MKRRSFFGALLGSAAIPLWPVPAKAAEKKRASRPKGRTPISAPVPGAPFLAFSDLQSGPKSGNTDTSKGQAAGQDGAIVSIWGNFLGDGGAISINGAPCLVYYWGKAVPPWTPANLANGYHDMQLVIAQVSHLAADGPGEIVVTVAGKVSNPLPFTVRPGRILFWTDTGNEAGDGTWQRPLLTLSDSVVNAKANKPGDIIYVKDVDRVTSNLAHALSLRTNGAPEAPMALVAYPGARCQIGTDVLEPLAFYSGDKVTVSNWKISKIILRGKSEGVILRSQCDLIGVNFSCGTKSDANTGAITNGARGSRVMGCEIHDVGYGGSRLSGLYHVLYYSATRNSSQPQPDLTDGYEIAWNYFHDIIANRSINIYNQQDKNPSGPGFYSAHIANGQIHHNAFVDCCGAAIGMLAGTVGNNWIYSNILVRCGRENPKAGDTYQLYNGMQFLSGYLKAGTSNTRDEARKQEIVHHVWHNTLIDCGHPFPATDARSGNSAAWNIARYKSCSFDFHNNLTIQNNGVEYCREKPLPGEVGSWSHNAWFGRPAAPAWEVNGVTSDPMLGADLKPRPGSPLIGAGSRATAPMRDFHGRPMAGDIGAIQAV